MSHRTSSRASSGTTEPVSSEGVHLNNGGLLAPVGCPILIEVDGVLIEAQRTRYISAKGDNMEYRLPDGSVIEGRYRWTYP